MNDDELLAEKAVFGDQFFFAAIRIGESAPDQRGTAGRGPAAKG